MGTITINKNNRLFWLGRYAERVYQGVVYVRSIYDHLLDDNQVNVDEICLKLGIPNTYESAEDFCRRYPFDRNLPESIISTADSMLGNGMVLRELLGSQTLSYLQMSVTALEAASCSKSSAVQFQWVLDDIMAFRGSSSEYVASQAVRNTIKTGASIERVGIMLRFGSEDEVTLKREANKLINRVAKTHLTIDGEKLAVISAYALSEEEHPNRQGLLASVESLISI